MIDYVCWKKPEREFMKALRSRKADNSSIGRASARQHCVKDLGFDLAYH